MQLISKFNKVIRFLSFAIDIFSKYAWVFHKPNKIWVDKASKFNNKSMKSWLEKNDIEMYSTHNEGKSVVGERFIKTLNNKIYK